MNFNIEFWIQILIYAVTFGITFGDFRARIKMLEKKMDIHNKLQDRMAVVEQSSKSAHHRIDELRDDINSSVKGGER